MVKKIDGSQKVARKIDRLKRKESNQQNHPDSDVDNPDDSNDEINSDNDDHTPTGPSERSSDFDAEDSLTSFGSNNDSNNYFNGNHAIHNNRYAGSQSIFSPVSTTSDSLLSSRSCCGCLCHSGSNNNMIISNNSSDSSANGSTGTKIMVESFAQTLSTGDIVITKVVFEENE